MIRSGRYSFALCVLTLALQGCGTAPEAEVAAGDDGEEGAGAASDSARSDTPARSDARADENAGDESAERERRGDEDSDFPKGRDPSDAQEVPENSQGCACGDLLPGIDIREENGELTIRADAPGAAAVTLRLDSGDCSESKHGLELSGDVNVDLGGLETFPLMDVDLAVVPAPGGGVTIAGTAGVVGSLLGGLLAPLDAADLRADVTLALGTDDEAQLDLALDVAALRLDTSGLPLANAAIDLAPTSVVVSTTGEHELIGVQGWLDAGASVPWLSQVPLSWGGAVEISALIADQALSSLQLEGDLQLDGGSLLCGITRLVPVALPAASVIWDASGLEVRARTEGSPYPTLSLLGDADITAAFGTSGWGIEVCGDGTLLGASPLSLFECLELSKSGITVSR